MHEDGNTIDYNVKRTSGNAARFHAKWTARDLPYTSTPGSLEFFLTERYLLFTSHGETVYRCRIHHEPWPLRKAELQECETTLFEADGLPRPGDQPFVVAGGPVNVDVWPLKRVGAGAAKKRAPGRMP